MNKEKARKILQALEPVDAQLEAALKKASQQLKSALETKNLDQANKNFKKLESAFAPLIESFDALKKSLEARDKQLEVELEKLLAETTLQVFDSSQQGIKSAEELKSEISAVRDEVNALRNKKSPDFGKQIKELETSLLGIISQETAEDSDIEDKFKELKKDIEARLKTLKLDILSRTHGGGNANRNIAIGGNPSVLSRYTDINIKAGSNVTITYANNDVTKQVDITFASTGGGSSVGGTVRSINRISTTQTAGATTGTDYAYICTAGLNLTLPTAVSNTNLYTVKNAAASSVLITTTSAQTIDGDSSVLLATQYAEVSLLNDGNDNWMIGI